MSDWPLEVEDQEGRELELSRERWMHIVSRHGELSGMQDEIINTIESPGEILKQSGRDDTFHYFRSVDGLEYNDYICAVVNIEECFIVTAYPTSRKKV